MAGRPNYEKGEVGFSITVEVPYKPGRRATAIAAAADRLQEKVKALGLVFQACRLFLTRFVYGAGAIKLVYSGYELPGERREWLRRAKMKGVE